MKNAVNVVIALLLSAVISYGLWSLEGPLRHYVAVGAAVFLTATLLPLLFAGYEHARRAVNLRTVSAVFFVIALLLNLAAAVLDFSATLYIVVSAIFFLVYVLLANATYNAKQ
ncbi:hypothetical protein [Azonexus sp.]|uniref:hypothetical protein n=1 Tax=Azonexus sp. TaxID=1872668 RepID=UPI0039E52100